MLILEDREIARLVSAFEVTAADPFAAVHATRHTRRGRIISIHRLRGFEITYTFHEPSNFVWVIDLHPLQG